MNKVNLSDMYSVMVEKPLNDYDRKTLNSLYLPIIGMKTLNLYYSLHDNLFTNNLLNISQEFNLLYSVGSDYHGPTVTPYTKIGSGINNNLNKEDATILSKILRSD